MEGVHAVVTHNDIPGENNYMPDNIADLFPFGQRARIPDWARSFKPDPVPVSCLGNSSHNYFFEF